MGTWAAENVDPGEDVDDDIDADFLRHRHHWTPYGEARHLYDVLHVVEDAPRHFTATLLGQGGDGPNEGNRLADEALRTAALDTEYWARIDARRSDIARREAQVARVAEMGGPLHVTPDETSGRGELRADVEHGVSYVEFWPEWKNRRRCRRRR